jgi:hypothetical protein
LALIRRLGVSYSAAWSIRHKLMHVMLGYIAFRMPPMPMRLPTIAKVCRYLVKDFGTSKLPKSTRLRGSHWAPAVLRPCRSATASQELGAGYAALPQTA